MKLSADAWAAISATASAGSAIFAAAALFVSALQTRSSARATSFASAQAFSAQCRELWNECRACGDDLEKFKSCLGEILASFELFCIAVNDLDMSDKVRDYITETIADYLSDMQAANYGELVAEMISKQHVCKELKNFAVQHRARFENPIGIAEMLGLPKASFA